MPRKTRSTRRSSRRVGGGFLDFLFGSSEEKKNTNAANATTTASMNGVSANVQASVGGRRKSRKARKARKSRKAGKTRRH